MNKLKAALLGLFSFLIITTYYNQTANNGENEMENFDHFRIKIALQDTAIYAILQDNPTTREFIAQLPLEIDLEDYAGTEKICYLPQKLSKQNSPAGYDPSAGDITYYAPWGNLAIFYKDFGYANGLIFLGKIEEGIEVLKSFSSINVIIESLKE